MTATDGFKKIAELTNRGCDKIAVCNCGHYFNIEYGGVVVKSPHLLLIQKALQSTVGQLCAEYKTPSTVVLKVVNTPVVSDMLVMSISRQDETVVINVKERVDW